MPNEIKNPNKESGCGRVSSNEIKQGIPANYDQLKIAANRTSNWRARLEAVEELGHWNDPKVIDVLRHRMKVDTVYLIQEAAYLKLKNFGEDVQLPAKRKGEIVEGVTKILIRIKKSLPADHTFEEFKTKLKKMRLDVYDVYEGDKGEDFEQWLEEQWKLLRT